MKRTLGDAGGYAYQNVGTKLSWKNGPPPSSHAVDNYELGGLGAIAVPGRGQSYQPPRGVRHPLGIFEKATVELPLPGAPEVLPRGMNGTDCGCGCNGKGTCGEGLGAWPPNNLTLAAMGGVAYLLYRHLKKKRRR